MDSKAFMSILFSLTVALATDSNATMNRLIEATDTTPFAQCNPFNAHARGITSCEKYFNSSSLTFEACDLNLGWHDICVGAIPEGKGSLREICPTECARKVLDPELEDEDALAVENFIDFLKKGGSKHGRRSSRSKVAGRRKLHPHSQAVPGYEAYPDHGSSPGNFIDQVEGLTVEECAGLCNGEGTLCVGFTIFDDGWCRLKSAITLRQTRRTFNRATYVKIVAPDVTWTFDGYGGCTVGNWMNIGPAATLEDAKALVLAHNHCSAEGSMLFFSRASRDESYGVRCATADRHDDCTEAASYPYWQKYILSFNV